MLLRRLLDALENTLEFEEPAYAAVPPGPPPGNAATGQYLLQQMQRSLSLRLKNSRLHWEWFAAHRPSTGDPWNPTAAPYSDIAAPPGHSYGDPFVIRWRDRSVVFLEDILMDTGRARLIALELTDEGRCSEPVVILDKPYHLSYPCVFASGNDMFLIPESSEDRSVQLYRATRFPYEWQLEKLLQQDVALVDTTPYYDNGVWYFFTASIAAAGRIVVLCIVARWLLDISSPQPDLFGCTARPAGRRARLAPGTAAAARPGLLHPLWVCGRNK